MIFASLLEEKYVTSLDEYKNYLEQDEKQHKAIHELFNEHKDKNQNIINSYGNKD